MIFDRNYNVSQREIFIPHPSSLIPLKFRSWGLRAKRRRESVNEGFTFAPFLCLFLISQVRLKS
jgi:hypothetical protein